jgi:AraC-like DNA-binding protein
LTIYRTYIPQPPLANFVDSFWLYEGYYQSHTKERRLPDGSMELVINLRDDMLWVYDRQNPHQFQSFRGGLISGAHSQFTVLDTVSLQSIIGIHFKAGGAFPFLPLPAGEMHNTLLSLDTLWGSTADNLLDTLREAQTPEMKFRTLEQALLAHATLPLARHPAVAFALREFQGVQPHLPTRTISNVTRQIGLSPRRFIQIFSDEVGLTPKLFCRVLRFQEVLHLIGRAQQVGWTNIALTCGYFDQAHLIHDFQAFSGLNPTAYLTQRGEHPNHVPLHNEG